MASVRSWALGCLGACALFGCGPAGPVVSGACRELLPGDLVITEVHANPDGSDGDREYIELFNATGAPVFLDGLTLSTRRSDGASPKSHRILGGSVDSGDYVVLGNTLADPLPPHVQYSYGSRLGSLRNSDAVLSVHCAEVLIDRVSYDETFDGRALQLDGRFTPDAELNDNPGRWCASRTDAGTFTEGDFGTPGAPNDPCEVEEPSVDGCMEAGSTRPVRSPEPGEVRITEWMANPRGPDADFEWVEVAFADDADLNGFQLGAAPDSLEVAVDQSDCVPVDAGERVVFGASPRAAPRVDAELGFSLGNSNARSIVAAFEGVELDRVDYDHTVEGSAWLLDAEGAVCLAASTDEYAPGNFGTPGQPNPPCPPVLLDGMCLEDDRARKIVSPTPGQVRITEWMASPAAAEDRDGEWVELHFTAAADLNGLTLSDLSGATTTVEGESCAGVSAGTRVVFVRNLDPTRNGGLQDADAQLSISLNNQNETITLSIDGETLDSITYARSETGASTQIDEAGNVCTASSPYGDGDLGTPGSANPHCP